jgi:hypothetical protein
MRPSQPVPWWCLAAGAFLAGAVLAPAPARAAGCDSHPPASLAGMLTPPGEGGWGPDAPTPPAQPADKRTAASPARQAPPARPDAPCRGPNCSRAPHRPAPAPAPTPPSTGQEWALLDAGEPPADPPPCGRVPDRPLLPPAPPGPAVYHPPR